MIQVQRLQIHPHVDHDPGKAICSGSRTAPDRGLLQVEASTWIIQRWVLIQIDPFFQTEAWSRSYLPRLIQINPRFRVEDWSRSKLGPGRWSPWISLIWKPPFRSFISCIVYRDFGTFSSKSDQGPFYGNIQAYPDKTPSMWSMIQTKAMFQIEDCSRSKLSRSKLRPGSSRGGSWFRSAPFSRQRHDLDPIFSDWSR